MSEKDVFKDKYFKSVVICSKDKRLSPCKKCGNDDEEWVQGVLKDRSSTFVYTYPGLKKRTGSVCSVCMEKAKVSKITKKTYTKIFLKDCKICNTPFVSKTTRGMYCSDICQNKGSNQKNLKRYQLTCETCNKEFIHNRVRKYCSKKCELISFRKAPVSKECMLCGSEFLSSNGKEYCSDKCLNSKPCVKCEINLVIRPRKVCDCCLDKKKKAKEAKKTKKNNKVIYTKTCPTCDKEFSTPYNYKIYCKPNHSEVQKEAKRLRKRGARKAKLPAESWNDIVKFKEGRPSSDYHLDHIIPLNHPEVCGLHNTWNFQWLRSSENSFKSNRFDGTMDNDSWKEEK